MFCDAIKNACARTRSASVIAPAGRIPLKMALEPERDHPNVEQFTLESVVKGQRCSN